MTRNKVAGVALVAACLFTAGATDASAPPGRYTIPTAGVVYDTMTKLFWQQVLTGVGQDGGGQYSWSGAFYACADLSLDGIGWRVPTEAELLTLVDWTTQLPPLIDGTYFPNTPPDVFWSSTPAAADPTKAWTVSFGAPFGNTNYVSPAWTPFST